MIFFAIIIRLLKNFNFKHLNKIYETHIITISWISWCIYIIICNCVGLFLEAPQFPIFQ